MARTHRKGGGGCKGRYKPKKMNKGWSTVRKVPVGSRPVLRITEPVDAKTEEAKSEG